MKALLLTLLLFTNIFALEKLNIDDPALSGKTRVLLESIAEHAIQIGTGSVSKTYVFVDPMCPFSRNYIQKISQSKKAKETNTYYIFLYKLPMFDSNKLSQYIFQSSNHQETLLEVMVKEEDIDLDATTIDAEKQSIISKISNVGEILNLKVRPYIIEFEKGSKYCTVSSGSAPCLEENDF